MIHTPITRIFGSLLIRDFRWFLTNNTIMAISLDMEILAQGWLVLSMTDSAFWVGAVAGSRGLGMVTFAVIGGVLADRFDRRKYVMAVELVRAIFLLGLGLLILYDRITLWQVFVMVSIQGTLEGTYMAGNHSLIFDIVGRTGLLNAMAARSASYTVARIIGSLLAGFLIARFSTASAFLFVGFIMLFDPLLLLPIRQRGLRLAKRAAIWRNLVGGLGYAASNRPVRTLLLLSALIEMFGFSFVVILPVFARDILNVGASGLGFLMAAAGAGALLGSISVGALGDFGRKVPLLMVTAGCAGLSILLFAVSPWVALSLVLVLTVGGFLTVYDVTMAALLQLVSADEMRRRIVGVYGLTFGFNPVGGFIIGAIATAVTAPFALGLGGVIILIYVGGLSRLLGSLRGCVKRCINPV